MKKIKHRQQNSEDIGLFVIVKRCLFFAVLFFAIAIALLLLFSLIFIRIEDSTTYLGLSGRLSLYISSFLCSFLLSRKNGQNYLFSGILLGAAITVLIFISSLIYPGSTANSVAWLLLIPASTVAGGLIGKRRSASGTKHRKHRK